MSEQEALIGVEHGKIDEVERAVRDCLGAAFFMDSVPHVAGLHLLVQDLSEEFAYADAFLKEQGLAEQDPFLRRFDMRDFNVEIRLFCQRWTIGAELQHVIADRLARRLSSTLQRRVLVRLEDGDVPFRLYDRGEVAEEFAEYSRDYMMKMAWVPGSPRDGGHGQNGGI